MPGTYTYPQQGQVQPQSFWDDIGSVAQVVTPIVLSLLQSRPPMPPPAQQGQVQPQSFWSDLGSVVNTGANLGHQLGLFNAAPQAPPAQQGQVRPQNFWDDIGSVAQVVTPIVLSLLQSRPPMPPPYYAGSQQRVA